MENKKFMNALFKGVKEGKVKGGDLTCGAALSSGETALIIIAKNAKPAVKTKFGQLGFRYDAEVITYGLSTEFRWIVEKKDVEVLAITDKELAEEIKETLNDIDTM